MTTHRHVSNAELIRVFVNAQDGIHIVNNRMKLLAFRDMETLTKLCHLVEAIADADRTPTGRALQALALATAAVLTTSMVIADDNPAIVSAWRSARDTYTALAG